MMEMFAQIIEIMQIRYSNFKKSEQIFIIFILGLLIIHFINVFLTFIKYKSTVISIIDKIELFLLLPIIFLLIWIIIKTNKSDKKSEKQKFNILYKKPNNDKPIETFFMRWLVYAINIIIALAIILAIFIYKEEFYKRIIISDIPDNISNSMLTVLAYSGEYVGGIIGTLLTTLMFLATLLMIYQQGKQIEISRKEFKQQQFESMLYTLLKEINQYKLHYELTQFYLSLRLIYQQLEEYKKYHHYDDRDFIFQKHNYIIQSNLDDNTLYRIFNDSRVRNAKYNDHTLFSNIKKLIEQYNLFKNIKDISEFSNDEKQHIDKYPLLSYLGNYGVIIYIFEQAKENKKNIKLYIENYIEDYKLYAIHEEDPIFYLSIIMYDENKLFLSTLNSKLKYTEFSNTYNRNLFLLQCIAYSVCNTKLYRKYKNTTKNILFKTTQFLDNQIDNESNDTNTVELLNTFNHCIYECIERNKDENKSSNLMDILLNILEETEYYISTTLLLSRIIVFKKERDWNDLRTVLEEMFEILHPFDEIEETRNEQIKRLQTNEIDIKITEKDLQRYRKNKQRLANFIAANKDKLHTPIMKK